MCTKLHHPYKCQGVFLNLPATCGSPSGGRSLMLQRKEARHRGREKNHFVLCHEQHGSQALNRVSRVLFYRFAFELASVPISGFLRRNVTPVVRWGHPPLIHLDPQVLPISLHGRPPPGPAEMTGHIWLHEAPRPGFKAIHRPTRVSRSVY